MKQQKQIKRTAKKDRSKHNSSIGASTGCPPPAPSRCSPASADLRAPRSPAQSSSATTGTAPRNGWKTPGFCRNWTWIPMNSWPPGLSKSVLTPWLDPENNRNCPDFLADQVQIQQVLNLLEPRLHEKISHLATKSECKMLLLSSASHTHPAPFFFVRLQIQLLPAHAHMEQDGAPADCPQTCQTSSLLIKNTEMSQGLRHPSSRNGALQSSQEKDLSLGVPDSDSASSACGKPSTCPFKTLALLEHVNKVVSKQGGETSWTIHHQSKIVRLEALKVPPTRIKTRILRSACCLQFYLRN